MFYEILLERKISLQPYYSGHRAIATIREKLSEVEGTCDENHGYIIAVTSINAVHCGSIQSEDGCIVCLVKYRAIVFKPYKGEVVDAVVTKVMRVGLFTEIGPLTCFVSKYSVPSSLQFDSNSVQPCFRTRSSVEKPTVIQAGSAIRVKLVTIRIDGEDMFAVGILLDDY